ncbi:MAG: hypothetical protein IPK96_14745 [Flammeovirgaceae bacterium]|jgi:hypothetical protein|nr:hypothetical protein [Flammeovirgaceae bacterium]
MNKPDESTLISYLYGELDAKEMQKVSDYLVRNPELMQQLEQWSTVRNTLTHVEDKEVIAPPIFTDGPNHLSRFWQSGYFKTVMSIAATFLLLLVAARLIGPEINYSKGELRISFNGETPTTKEVVEVPSVLTPTEVQGMIDVSLSNNNDLLSAAWNSNNEKIQASLKNNLASNSAKIDELMKVASQASQDQVRTFVAGLQEDNLRLMKDYLQLSAKDQKVYVESLLVDFSKYLQEQRKQDLMLFQTRMSSIEKNSDQFKQETELILASIISNPESTLKKVNNY